MSEKGSSSRLQEVIETVETLPQNDQALLVEIIHRRLVRHRRSGLGADIAEVRQAYEQGKVKRGTVADLMEEFWWGESPGLEHGLCADL